MVQNFFYFHGECIPVINHHSFSSSNSDDDSRLSGGIDIGISSL